MLEDLKLSALIRQPEYEVNLGEKVRSCSEGKKALTSITGIIEGRLIVIYAMKEVADVAQIDSITGQPSSSPIGELLYEQVADFSVNALIRGFWQCVRVGTANQRLHSCERS